MDIQMIDACYGLGGQAALVGFPMEDGSVGSAFYPSSPTLGMSSVCKNKEAAWQFLRELLLPSYKNMDALSQKSVPQLWEGIPVNRSDYDLLIKASSSGKLTDSFQRAAMAGFPSLEYHAAAKEDISRFEDLLNSIEAIVLYDRSAYNIAYEAAGAYFAGHRTLDETAQMIQDRVRLYLDEQM